MNQIWITGSQKSKLRKHVGDSLERNIEYSGFQSIDVKSTEEWSMFYINTYLQGAIKDELSYMDRLIFTKVLKVLAARTETTYIAYMSLTGCMFSISIVSS